MPAPLSELQPTCADLANTGDFGSAFSHVPQLEGLLVCFHILQYVSVLFFFQLVSQGNKAYVIILCLYVGEKRELGSF